MRVPTLWELEGGVQAAGIAAGNRLPSLSADVTFIQEAIRRAEAAGYVPAQWQREVDWNAVRMWAQRAQAADFAWRPNAYDGDGAILIGPAAGGKVAVHAGQHRILGGLMAGNPVPAAVMTWISVPDRGRGWQEAMPEVDLLAILH